MKIWQIKEPYDIEFACYNGGGGAWKKVDNREGICPECTSAPLVERTPPCIMEWDPGCDCIGHFTWNMGSLNPLITEAVAKALQKEGFRGWRPGPVKMVQDPKLKRPKRPNKRTKPRIWLPYEGPKLFELWLTTNVHADLERSSIRTVLNCSTCGRIDYEVDGVETIEGRWNPRRGASDKIHTLRKPGEGLFVLKSALKGADICGVREFDGWHFVTDRVKAFIETQEYENISFLEMGELL